LSFHSRITKGKRERPIMEFHLINGFNCFESGER
jgi:hypothetical protein